MHETNRPIIEKMQMERSVTLFIPQDKDFSLIFTHNPQAFIPGFKGSKKS
jgi:hypothetical protein